MDPIAVEPVDEVVVTTLVDDFFDALLTGAAAVPDWAQGSCGTRYTLTAA